MHHNGSFRRIRFVMAFLFIPFTASSQVIIKERVEITPRPPMVKSGLAEAASEVFAENPNKPDGANAGAAVVILRPCSVSATGSVEVTPRASGEYPNTSLGLYVDGAVVASYTKAENMDSPGYTSVSSTKARVCGFDGALLTSPWSLEISSVTVTVNSSSATITFRGKLYGSFEFVATASLSGTADARYDLATMDASVDRSALSVCQNTAQMSIVLKDNKGDSYGGSPCTTDNPPMTVSVQSSADVILSCQGQQGKELSLPPGDATVAVIWNYRGETEQTQAVLSASLEGITKTALIDLLVNQPPQSLVFTPVPFVQHLCKTDVVVLGGSCSLWGQPTALPNGTPVTLAILEGKQWGYLLDPATGQRGDSLTGVRASEGVVKVEYWAKGEEPQGYENVRLRAIAFGAETVMQFSVAGNSLRVRAGRTELTYGDTTVLVVERMRPWDGTYEVIPETWNTMYEIVEGDTTGYLSSLDTLRTGTQVFGHDPAVVFHAREFRSPRDSVNVMVRVIGVETWGGGGGVTKANDGLKPKFMPNRVYLPSPKRTGGVGGKLTQTMSEPPPDFWDGNLYFGVVRLTVKRQKEALDHFAVTFEKDTIAFTETSRIFVQAKDIKDVDMEFDEGQLLELSQMTNAEYGTFIDDRDDTVNASPANPANISYGKARAGSIRFAALRRNPEFSVPIRVLLSLKADGSKSGNKEIMVIEQTLRISVIGPKEVWPLMPEFTPQQPHPDNTTVIEVLWTRGGRPHGDDSVKVYSDYVDGSGGHDHIFPRRSKTNEDSVLLNYGSFVSSVGGRIANPLTVKTQMNGKAAFGYVASRFGDIMKVEVRSCRTDLLSDTAIIAERVPDLEQLPTRPYFHRIGGRIEHHGSRDDLLYLDYRLPDNNHWGTKSTLTKMDSISSTYHRMFPNDSVLHINDISLPSGGRFDADGSWEGNNYHEYHRLGRDVDIKSTLIPVGDKLEPKDDTNRNGQHDEGEHITLDVNGNGIFERNREAFRLICLLVGKAKRVRLESDPEHYHIYFWGRSEFTVH